MSRRQFLVQVRPRMITIIGTTAAALVLGTMVTVGILLRSSQDGVSFRTADQVGLIGVGILVAAAIMMVARPRLRADASGVWVRNVLGETFFEWPLVYRIGFHEGSHWAVLELADDETFPVTAIQAMDRQRAVQSLKAVRAVHATYAPTPPVVSPEAAEKARRRRAAAPPRQLGRLEQIDREKAAKRGIPGPRPPAG